MAIWAHPPDWKELVVPVFSFLFKKEKVTDSTATTTVLLHFSIPGEVLTHATLMPSHNQFLKLQNTEHPGPRLLSRQLTVSHPLSLLIGLFL